MEGRRKRHASHCDPTPNRSTSVIWARICSIMKVLIACRAPRQTLRYDLDAACEWLPTFRALQAGPENSGTICDGNHHTSSLFVTLDNHAAGASSRKASFDWRFPLNSGHTNRACYNRENKAAGRKKPSCWFKEGTAYHSSHGTHAFSFQITQGARIGCLM